MGGFWGFLYYPFASFDPPILPIRRSFPRSVGRSEKKGRLPPGVRYGTMVVDRLLDPAEKRSAPPRCREHSEKANNKRYQEE